MNASQARRAAATPRRRALAWLLLPLRAGRRPPGFIGLCKAMQLAHPWAMVEVFMLGILVSLVKLSHLADVILGAAFWAMAALIVVLTLAGRAFDPRLLWQAPTQTSAEAP